MTYMHNWQESMDRAWEGAIASPAKITYLNFGLSLENLYLAAKIK